MLQLKDIVKDYPTGTDVVKALKGISINFRKSEFVSVLGQSGCGKTTLLNIIGGLDKYTSGDLVINGKSTKDFKDKDWDAYRNNSIGFVFQSYNLIPHQTVLSNVELALTISGVSKSERRKRAKEVLEKVGLGDQLNKKPNQMSGGQMQRVAIARALVNDPDILLADEPTGALDSETSVQVMELLKEIAKDKLVIMVTHNPNLAERYSTRIVKLLDGEIIDDSNPYSDEEEAAEFEGEYAPRRTSMSTFTAFSLSLNNLLTKKARTILTAFAGSIGIIGIALILSLSSGFQDYINDVQEETLSSYPITIQSSSVDYSDLMKDMMGSDDEDEDTTEHEDGKVYSGDVMGEMMIALISDVKENDLETFKAYIEDEGNGFQDILSDISYTYNTPLYIYNENAVEGVKQVNPSTFMDDAGFSSVTETQNTLSGFTSSFGGSSSMDMWSQLMDNQDILDQQYDVVAGHWPEAKDEVVLVIDRNNELSDFTMYTLGLRDSADLSDFVTEVLNGNEVESPEELVFTYDDLLNMSFKLVLPTDFYQKNDDGTWTDMREDETYMKNLLENAMDIKICGIIRPSETAYATSISSGMIGYTSELAEYIVAENEKSEIIQQQLENQDVDVITGLPFENDEAEPDMSQIDLNEIIAGMNLSEDQMAMMSQMSDEEIYAMLEQYGYFASSETTLEDNLTLLGYSQIAVPATINLYCSDFASKDKLTDLIDKYNEDNPESEITYTDYIGLMMSSVTSIINAITYVLIAFVAISLVVSSIMIGIITYISVLERTKEIGILRSIGASKRDISRVFNAETFIIGFISGMLGIGVTVLLNIPISKIIESVINTPGIASLPPVGAVALVIISVVLTLIGGLIPSRLAAKRDPVIALRTD